MTNSKDRHTEGFSPVIDELRRRRRKKNFTKWIFRAVLAEAFFTAISPTAATVALVFGALLLFMRFYSLRDIPFVNLPFDVPALLFFVFGAISIFISPDMAFSFYNWYNLAGVYALTYLLVGQGIFEAAQVRKILLALFCGAALSILYGFFQYIFGVSDVTEEMRWVDGAAFPEITARIYSTWGNPNIFAGYLDMIILIALGFWNESTDNRPKKIFLASFMLIGVLALILTYSRGAIISLAVVFAIYGIMRDRRLLVAALCVGVGLILFDTTLAARFIGSLHGYDSSSALRFALWDSTLTMIADHPIFGIGWGAYFKVYPEYDYFVQNPDVVIYHAHNLYLNYAAEIGVIGAAAFCWFLFGTIKLAFNQTSLTIKTTDFSLPTMYDGFVARIKTSVIDNISFAEKNNPDDEPELSPLLQKLAAEHSDTPNNNTADKNAIDAKGAAVDSAYHNVSVPATMNAAEPIEAAATISLSSEDKTLNEAAITSSKYPTALTETATSAVNAALVETAATVVIDKESPCVALIESATTATETRETAISLPLLLTDDDTPKEMTLSEAIAVAKAITRAHDAARLVTTIEELNDEVANNAVTDMTHTEASTASQNIETETTATDEDDAETENENDEQTTSGESDESNAPSDNRHPTIQLTDITATHTNKYLLTKQEERNETAANSPTTTPQNWRDALTWDDEQIKHGLTAGIALAFVSVALNGITDDLLFNIPTSMLFWFLAALVAVINADDENFAEE